MSITTEVSAAMNIILSAAEDCLTVGGRTLPEHRFISHNTPSWDCCDLLVVHLVQGKPANQFPRPQHYRPLQSHIRWAADLDVTILRCVPTFDGTKLPSFTELNDSAERLTDDAWTIYHGLGCRGIAGTLLTGCPCDLIALGPLKPLGPQGGCGGYHFTITIEPSGAP